MTIYNFTATERKSPPASWCLPSWHNTLLDWQAKYGRVAVVSDGCKFVVECNLDPEAMRAKAEVQLRELGVWPKEVPLSLDIYTLARNLASEFSDGTPEEKVAICLAGLNRTKEAGASTLTEHLLGTKGRYGKQIGIARPAATSQDPTVADVLTAALVYNGFTQGWMEDITLGATHYLDRVSQDAVHARREAQRHENPEAGDSVPTGVEVYDSWTAGGDYLTWVGHIPNVRPYRLMLLRRRRELGKSREGIKERATAKSAGHKAILAQNRAPSPYAACPLPTEQIIAARPGVAAPTGTSISSRIYSGFAIAGVAGVTSVAIGLLVGRMLGTVGGLGEMDEISSSHYYRRQT